MLTVRGMVPHSRQPAVTRSKATALVVIVSECCAADPSFSWCSPVRAGVLATAGRALSVPLIELAHKLGNQGQPILRSLGA